MHLPYRQHIHINIKTALHNPKLRPPSHRFHVRSIPRLIQINLKPSPNICRNRLQLRQHAKEIRRDVEIAIDVKIRDRERRDGRGLMGRLPTVCTAATYPTGLDALSEAVGFGVWVLRVPGGGCGGACAGHVVGAVEAADDEVGVEALEFAVDQGEG